MTTQTSSSDLVERTLTNLRNAWREMTDSARVALTGAVRPDLTPEDTERIERQITACLEGWGGEVSARARAADLGLTYLSPSMPRAESVSCAFWRATALPMMPWMMPPGRCTTRRGRPSGAPPPGQLQKTLVVSPRMNLLRQFSALSNGVKFLVDILAEVREIKSDDPDLAALDGDIKELLSSWLDVGLLNLQRITWNAPSALLEKLSNYKAVHAIWSWQDLKHRLDSADWRFYAFFSKYGLGAAHFRRGCIG